MIVAAVILALGGAILIGWLAGRSSVARWLRTLLRVVVIPLFIIGIAVLAFVMNRTAFAAVPTSTPIVVPSERVTVKNGTLNVTLNSTGALAATDQQTLTFDTSAVVTDVKVAVGDHEIHGLDDVMRGGVQGRHHLGELVKGPQIRDGRPAPHRLPRRRLGRAVLQ